MNPRLRTVKTVLWAIVGAWVAVTAARFLRGLGPTTNLSDAAPWGLWIAFDVLAGVALAAGGFVLAATVYVFGLQRYRPFVRPAILTAFLGYAAVAVGLLYDLGLPWHIWHPIIYPQVHSVLFEVAMCVMLYLTVLTLEFAPTVLEHPWFDRAVFRTVLHILKKITIVLVIAGIVLSTLHQSSLGSLFLIAPHRLHPLWYSPMIYVLFFVSAVGLGLMTVTMESLASGWLFGHKVRTELLSGLGLAGSIVLELYAVLRLGDVAVRGRLGLAFDGSLLGFLFLFEVLLCAVLPAVLLAVRRVRSSIGGLAVCSAMVIAGMVLNRLSVCLLAFERPEGVTYFPTWMEFTITLGIVAAAMLAFIFFVEHLKVYSDGEMEAGAAKRLPPVSYDPATLHRLTPESIAAPRRYSLIAATAAALAVVFLPNEVIFGPQPVPEPVYPPRTVEGYRIRRAKGQTPQFTLAGTAKTADVGRTQPLMIIDGNRNGRMVFFTHQHHIEECGGEASCVRCHHLNLPFDKNTSCHECHRDMYERTDIFSHASHIAHLDGNRGCKQCHVKFSQPKSRRYATPCIECHADMLSGAPFLGNEQKDFDSLAPGYKGAMHRLCIGCHRRTIKEKGGRFPEVLARCDGCHDNAGDLDLRQLGPYLRDPGSKRPFSGPAVAQLPDKPAPADSKSERSSP